MMRIALLLSLAACATPPPATVEVHPLDRLRERTNAYASFHYRAELTAAGQVVPIELAWSAPDRAVLRYGKNYTVIFAGGTARFYTRQGTYALNYAEETARLRKAYGLELRAEPGPLFLLTDWEALLSGRAPKATIAWGPPGSRLGWIDDLRRFHFEGGAWRRGAIEIELREDGFIGRAAIGPSNRLALREISIDRPVAEAVFAAPEGSFQDVQEQARPNLVKALEENFHRWILETDPPDETLEALVRVDLARRYEPEKMTELLRQSLAKSLETYRKQNPGAQPELLRAKVELDRGKTLGSVEIMENEIQSEFERDLDRYFRGMAVLPPVAAMRKTADRWRALVRRQVDRQIRTPFELVFNAALAP